MSGPDRLASREATAPWADPPPRARRTRDLEGERRGRWILLAIAIVVALVVLTVLATVSVAQTSNVSFAFSNHGVEDGTYYTNFTAVYSGTLDFSWSTSPDGAALLTITDPANTTLYTHDSDAGSGSIAVTAGVAYTFGLYALSPETVDISGSLHYTGPLI